MFPIDKSIIGKGFGVVVRILTSQFEDLGSNPVPKIVTFIIKIIIMTTFFGREVDPELQIQR